MLCTGGSGTLKQEHIHLSHSQFLCPRPYRQLLHFVSLSCSSSFSHSSTRWRPGPGCPQRELTP